MFNCECIYSNLIYPKTVQLLCDVIEYFPKEISNAILFVTKNTLLCETSEDARKVAYEVHLNDKYSVSCLRIIHLLYSNNH